MASMYNAIDRLVMVVVVFNSLVTCDNEANRRLIRDDPRNTLFVIEDSRRKIALPIGAVAPARATTNVMNHFIRRVYVFGFSTSATNANWPNKPLRLSRATLTGGPTSVSWRSRRGGGSSGSCSSSAVLLEAPDREWVSFLTSDFVSTYSAMIVGCSLLSEDAMPSASDCPCILDVCDGGKRRLLPIEHKINLNPKE